MVAELGCPRDRGVWPPQEQIIEKICEQIADVHVPQVVEQTIEVHKMAEQILDVLVPEMVEQLVEVPKTVLLDRTQQRTVEQIVDARVLQVVEELAELYRVFSKDRIQQRTVEQIIPAIPLAGKIVELLVIQTRQSVDACVQHLVNTVKVEKYKIIEETVQRMEPIIKEKINQATKHTKIPQVQFLDKADVMLVDVQRQIPVAQTMQETMEVPLLQFSDKVVGIPVAARREVSQLQVIDVPVVLGVQASQSQVVAETAETHSCRSLIRWLMSLLLWSHRFHRCMSRRRQSRSHSCSLSSRFQTCML